MHNKNFAKQIYHLGIKQINFYNFWRPTQFIMEFKSS
jgi:hypothetical protein